MRSRRFDVAIVSAGHDVADARLHKIVGALRRQGLTVQMFGLGDVTGGPTGAYVQATERGSFLRRGFRAAALPWRCDASVIMTVDPDVIPMARLAGKVRRRKVVVDIHEDYASLLSDRSWARGFLGSGARVLVKVSTRLASGADLTSVTDSYIPPINARKRLVIENMPDVDLLTITEDRDPRPRAVYVGDLRESRGVFDMVEAVVRTQDWTLDLVGPLAASDAPRLTRRLSAPDAAGRVRLHGRMPPERAWKLVAGAWAGLILLRDTPAFREAMPTKLYEYLMCGMPALSTRLPRQVALVESSGAGRIIDSVDEAAEVLTEWSRNPDQLQTLSKAAREWAAEQREAPSPYDELASEIAALIK